MGILYEESDKIELKSEMTDDLDKEIIAFLNTHGGSIYIGVDDDGKVLGVPGKLKDDYDERISAIITNNIKPNCRNKVDFFYNEDNVLEITVGQGDKKPYYLTSKGPKPSGTYIRVGRSKRPADDGEILKLIRDYSPNLWEKEESKNQKLHFTYLSIYFKALDIEFSGSKYLTLDFVNEEGKFTNLALLFSDENPIEIKFAKYDDQIDFLFKREYRGPLCLVADQILKQADEFNVVSARILPNRAARVEKVSFPGKSLREAILNAICHADYEFPSNIKVEFFPSYCRISNPGAIYRYSLEEVLNGKQSFRNPGVVRILYMLGFIENYGTGLQRISEAYSDSKEKPSFENMLHSFTVDLPNLNLKKGRGADGGADKSIEEMSINESRSNPEKGIGADSGADSGADISIEELLIKEMRDNPKISRKELASRLQMGTTSIYRILKKLKSKNKIKRVGPDFGGYWEIVDKE